MRDLIDRQQAIDATWEEPTYTDPINVLTEVRDRIKALPSAQPQACDDAISREDAKWVVFCNRDHVEDQANAIDSLPCVQPERKKGEWIIHNVSSRNCHPTNRHFAECSECGTLTREWRGNLFPPSLRFCTNCGAEMRGDNNG